MLVGKGFAQILGYAKPENVLANHVDDEDKLNSKTLPSFQLDLGQRGGWLINESGLYSLILSSKLPPPLLPLVATKTATPQIWKCGG